MSFAGMPDDGVSLGQIESGPSTLADEIAMYPGTPGTRGLPPRALSAEPESDNDADDY